MWVVIATSTACAAVACGARTPLDGAGVSAAIGDDVTIEGTGPGSPGAHVDASFEATGEPEPPGREAGGPDASSSPAPLAGASGVVAIVTGVMTACALRANGQVQCWGGNADGELGDGQLGGPIGSDASPPVVVSGIHTATAISQGGYTRCAFLASGDVSCWGDNGWGELWPPASDKGVSIPVTLPGLYGARAVGSAYEVSCGLLADGGVSCWGNENGPPYGDTWTISAPAPVVDISVSEAYGCLLLADATVACFGDNDEGQLGVAVEDFANTTATTRVVGLAGVTSIASGDKFSCAIVARGQVACWGWNNVCELGVPQTICTGGNGGACSPVPVMVEGLSGVKMIAAGDDFACALLSDGTVDCWGANIDGVLGNDAGEYACNPPGPVSGLTGVVAISATLYQACALTATGDVYCWGSNYYENWPTPERVPL